MFQSRLSNYMRFAEKPSYYWAIAYLIIAGPALLSLCFFTHVFRSLDEPAHFLRVVQLSEGDLMPVIGPDHASTGSYQSKGVIDFVHFYGIGYTTFLNSTEKASLAEIGKLYAIKDIGSPEFVEHSNTTIYFPSAYIPPLVGVIIAKRFSNRPLVWFYSGRVGSAIFVGAVTALALYYSGTFAPILFVISMLPIIIFQSAAISADGLLIVAIMGMASAISPAFDNAALSIWRMAAAITFMILFGMTKFAYIPLVFAPFVIVYFYNKETRAQPIIFFASAFVVLICSLFWGLSIKNLTFTMREDPEAYRINVNEQINFVVSHPIYFLNVLMNSFRQNLLPYVSSFLGAKIGWFNVKLPVVFPAFAGICLIANAFLFGNKIFNWLSFLSVLALALSSIFAVFLLLYLQWNFVGNDVVEGVQGRYFLPVMPVLLMCVPYLKSLRKMKIIVCQLTIVWAFTSTLITVYYVWDSYWS